MFKTVRDASHNLIDVTLSGFFEIPEAERYVSQVKDLFFKARMTAGYRMIIDCSDCQLQKQEVLGVFAKHMESFPKARRIAVVVGGSLIRMQVRRIMTQPYLQTFNDRRDAMEWLISDLGAAAA